LSPILSGYTEERTRAFYQDLLERIRSNPRVVNAAVATEPLLSGDEWDRSVTVEGYQAKDGEDMQAFMNSLSPGYFSTMGIALLEGRDFDRRDLNPPWRVCIVNRKFAQYFFGGKSPIGRHVKRGEDLEIIGMVEDSLFEGPREGVHKQVFVPFTGGGNGFAVYARTSMDSTAAYSAMRDSVKSLASAMPVYQMKTLASQLDEVLLTERLVALLSAGFGILATLLAAIGLYGVMAFVVTRRTKEMGVRMALGAHPSTVIWLVMKEVLLLLVLGLAIGLPAALGLGRFVASQLYAIKASDPTIAVVTVTILFVVAAVAGLIPAHRASRIDPILALRYE
jgi:predicted permease